MPLPTSSEAARRKVIFSPIVAIASDIAVPTVTLPAFAALIFSTSAPTASATCAIILTSPWNCSLRATKSVSELTSTTTPLLPDVSAPIRPSAATRPAFFAAFDRPFLRSQSMAACMSPLFSVSACLQSIMPTPVVSRRSLTIAAVIDAIVEILCLSGRPRRGSRPSPLSAPGTTQLKTGWPDRSGQRVWLFRFRGQSLGLGYPRIGAGRQSDLFADLMGGIVIEFGQLPEMEDAEIVELLLDRTRHAGELLEVVGSSSRPCEALEARRLRRCWNFLADRSSGSSDIDAGVALGTRDAIDHRAGNQIAIQRDGAAGIVIAGDDVRDSLGIGIGVDDRSDRNVQPLSFLDRDVFFVGVDHEDHIGQTAHFLDPAQRTIKLVALALQRQPFLFGVGGGIVGIEHLIEVPQTLDRT